MRLCVLVCSILVLPGFGQETKTFSMADFATVDKIDLHFHMAAMDSELIEKAEPDRFRFLNIVVDSQGPLMLRQRLKTGTFLHKAHPGRVALASAFSMEGWDKADWEQKTLTHLGKTFQNGAVGIKVWKNIGMVHRNAEGKLVMIDDPKFDPIFRSLTDKGIVVIGHLGEPKNCWLPLEEMTVKNDRNYFAKNPNYHMHKHPGGCPIDR